MRLTNDIPVDAPGDELLARDVRPAFIGFGYGYVVGRPPERAR